MVSVYSEFDMTGWMGIFAPADMPNDLVESINRDLVWALNLPETRKYLIDQGAEVVSEGPSELAAFVRRESALFEKIINKTGIPEE